MLSALETTRDSLWLRPPDAKPLDLEPDPPEPAPVVANPPVPARAAAMETKDTTDSAVVPAAPTTLGETGLPSDAILALVLKVLFGGERSGRSLSDEIKVTYGILEPLINAARQEQLIEVKRASGAGTAGYEYALTDRGRDRAKACFDVNGYVGPAPVPLD